MVAVAETYDFEITPAAGAPYWVELRRGNGAFEIQAPVIVAE